jgi:plastocyanin
MAQTHEVEIKNMKFEPSSLTISVGDTVNWTNRMNMAHTVTADVGSEPDSGAMAQNKTFSYTFSTASNVGYHCEIHPQMTGTIIVA